MNALPRSSLSQRLVPALKSKRELRFGQGCFLEYVVGFLILALSQRVDWWVGCVRDGFSLTSGLVLIFRALVSG